MMLFRNAVLSDLDAIYHLAVKSGVGITTLPKNKKMLHKRLEWAISSFKKNLAEAESEYYLFVLEDVTSKNIVGLSAIESKTGTDTPFYSYKLTRRTRICRSLNIRVDYDVLNLVNDNQNCTEICTLFLDPDYRRNNNGHLLSKGRFLFLAQYNHRFSPTVIAEMRGVSDDNGHSPFWENVGQHFFQMTYSEADRLTLATDKQFIADLMPRNSLYVKLLSAEAQAVIGQPHHLSLPAMKILLKEGFRYSNYIDIFDAGPTLEVPLSKIRTVQSSQLVTVKNITFDVSSAKYLISSAKANFKATLCEALVNETEKSCIISQKTATLLEVNCGDELRVAPLI